MVSKLFASKAWRSHSIPLRRYNNASLQNIGCAVKIAFDGRQRIHWLQPSASEATPIVMYSTTSVITQRALLNGRRACSENQPCTSPPFGTTSRRPVVTSLLFGRAKKTTEYQRPWHDPNFMQDSSPEEVEKWLLSLVQSARRDAQEKRIRSSSTSDSSSHNNIPIVYFDNDFVLDASAYLRVLEAYTRSKGGGSPQKAEYWIGVLERHYSRAVELFYETYGIRADNGGGALYGSGGVVDKKTNHATDEGRLDAVIDDGPQEDPPSPFASFIKRNNKSSGVSGLSSRATTTSYYQSTQTKRNVSTSINPRRAEEQTFHNSQRDNAAAIVRNLQPTVECYNAIIEAWGHDKDLISVVRSRRWLSKLEDEAKNTNHSILRVPLAPNARSYDLYLHSLSRGLGKHHKVHKERAEEAEQLLNYRLSDDAPLAIRPTTDSFNYVLRAWTRCRKLTEVAGKVMNLVLMMEKIQKDCLLAQGKGAALASEEWSWKQSISPDTKTYTMAVDGWIIKAGLKAEKWRSKQLAISNTLKQKDRSWNHSSEHQSRMEASPNDVGGKDDGTQDMEKAETILKYIRDLDSVGLTDVRATVIAYNTLLSGWARLANEINTNVPLKSEQLLHDMMALAEHNENAAPDVTSFNLVIKAWSRTKQANSADRCEYWLRKMIHENHFDNNDQDENNFIVKPNTGTYNIVMDAHLQRSDPARAEDMLLEMDATNGIIPPNNESFSKVIRGWLYDELHTPQYGLPGSSIENAWNWLEELLQREKKGDVDLGPAPELFSSILKTAARTSACGENMLIIGERTFLAMKASRFPPDYLAYTWLLEIALKVLSSPKNDKRREEVITRIYEQCCKDGLLSAKFVSKIANGPFHDEGWTTEESEWMCNELFGDPPFPTAWSRNLKNRQEQQPLVRKAQTGKRRRNKHNTRK